MDTRDAELVGISERENVMQHAMADGPVIDRIVNTHTLAGTVEGEGRQSLMIFYRDGAYRDGSRAGEWVGLDMITGTVGGRSGSFAVRQRGSFSGIEGDDWSGTAEIVPWSGTGDLAGLRGEGSVTLHGPPRHAEYAIRFTFD
jgi:hypothetical protein